MLRHCLHWNLVQTINIFHKFQNHGTLGRYIPPMKESVIVALCPTLPLKIPLFSNHEKLCLRKQITEMFFTVLPKDGKVRHLPL